jgi:alpha-tubulin suppressor-like RCC1 family protein
VSGGVSFASISAPHLAPFTCALTATGTVYCWGNGENGTLGRGTLGNAASPAPVAGGHVFTQVDAGIFHACALEAGTGRVFCWGVSGGYFGPTPVAIPGDVRFTSITVGDHGCGLATDGRYYCWEGGAPVKVALQF